MLFKRLVRGHAMPNNRFKSWNAPGGLGYCPPSIRSSPATCMGHWMIGAVALNGISLIIDSIDVVHYVTGDRKPSQTVSD